MITVSEIKKKAERKFNDFLLHKIDCYCNCRPDEEKFFPLYIKSNKGKMNDLREYEQQIKPLYDKSKEKTGTGYALEFEEVSTLKFGHQQKLRNILFENEDDFLSFLNKETDCKQMLLALEKIIESRLLQKEKLCDWAKAHLAELCMEVENENFWSDICLSAAWLNSNHDSNLYIREIPLPVHTKFIEQNKVLIKSLTQKSDSELSFEETFGLKGKSSFVRFRTLDENLSFKFSKTILTECNMRLEDFKRLNEEFLSQIKTIFIVENEMVYLTFPKHPDSICIWGQGYKVNILNDIEWFKSKNLYYFGDLDEHGFDILSTYRVHYPDVKSFCMSQTVLCDYDKFRVECMTRTMGKIPGLRIPENLTKEESATFMNIRNSERNRLEQERISVEYIKTWLEKLP